MAMQIPAAAAPTPPNTLRIEGAVTEAGEEFSCTSPAVAAYGIANEPDEPSRQGFLRFQGSPRQVDLAIFRDDVELGSRSFRPRYEETEPNGKGCGICRNATVSLDF